MNNYEFITQTVAKLRDIIRTHFPEKFEELYEEEDLWLQISLGNYQVWIQKNIPLDKSNKACVLLYDVAYNSVNNDQPEVGTMHM
jgi:hypothetical protein